MKWNQRNSFSIYLRVATDNFPTIFALFLIEDVTLMFELFFIFNVVFNLFMILNITFVLNISKSNNFLIIGQHGQKKE